MVQCGARARSSVLLEFFLMVRRKVSGNSRTLGFLREAQNSGVKHPRTQEFKNGAMGTRARSLVLLEFLASRILLNGPPQDLREQPLIASSGPQLGVNFLELVPLQSLAFN